LSLKNSFQHIIYKDLKIKNRQLDFYPDFYGQDSYVYLIQFDRNVAIVSSVENTEIRNEFGELMIKIEQIKPDVIKISSLFSVTNYKITADKIVLVKDIYNRIEELSNSSIEFVLE
ncbi:MAG: hypothetical protein GQ527_01730, partial [Bacteroidales bacterium]|nr:hypothetical protein [Bacteroidales bacterium]